MDLQTSARNAAHTVGNLRRAALPWLGEHPLRHLAFAVAGAVACLLSTCSPRTAVLDRIHAEGVLRVVAINGPTGCYEDASGIVGFDCDLVTRLADQLGARVEFEFVESPAAVIQAIQSGRAELGVGGLTVSPKVSHLIAFGPPLRSVTQQLIYRINDDDDEHLGPRDLSQVDGRLVIPAGGAAADALRLARADMQATAPHTALLARNKSADFADLHPAVYTPNSGSPSSVAVDQRWDLLNDMPWRESSDLTEEDLLAQVSEHDIDYTVASSDMAAMGLHYYPNLRVAFDLTDPQPQAWVMPRSGGVSLRKTVEAFVANLSPADIARLDDRYFGSARALSSEDINEFSTKAQARLPRYQRLFEAAARRYQLDWRLLAAIGYQESRWEPGAITGVQVRGLMMLTEETAQHMGVSDRMDAAQSIMGGARYFSELHAMLPDSIPEPDRTWMTLAAYNQGLGHLLDARQLVRNAGGNPDHWVDVRNAMPLLSRPAWYSKARYGYARTHETLDFVANIRSYSDILEWMSETGVIQDHGDDRPLQIASRSTNNNVTPKSPPPSLSRL